MASDFKKKQSPAAVPHTFNATEIIASLSKIAGWKLTGDGEDVGIERTFEFADYYETMSFINAVAFIAHAQDHHPDVSLHYSRCVVRFSTHAAKGLTAADFACAGQVNALIP